MYTIDLSDNDANQSFTVTLNGNVLYIRLSTFRDSMFADLELNGTPILTGRRVVDSMPLVPKRYERALGGNVGIVTRESVGDYPGYTDLDGVRAAMVYSGDSADA